MTTYQRLITAMDKIKDDSITRQQIESLMEQCTIYWAYCVQYSKLNQAREQLRQHLHNENLSTRVYISFFWRTFCCVNKIDENNPQKDEEENFFKLLDQELEDHSKERIEAILKRAEARPIEENTIKRIAAFLYSEYEDICNEDNKNDKLINIKSVSRYSFDKIYKASVIISKNLNPQPQSIEESVNAVLSGRFADIVEKHIEAGTQKGRLALYFLIASYRRALTTGTITNYTPFSDSNDSKKKKKGEIVFTAQCKENLKRVKERIDGILKQYDGEAAEILKENVEEYAELCEHFNLN